MAAKPLPSNVAAKLAISRVGMVTSTEKRFMAEGLQSYRVFSKLVLVLNQSNLEEGSILGVLCEDDICLGEHPDVSEPWVMLPAGSFVRHHQMRQGRVSLQSPGWLMTEHASYGTLLEQYLSEHLRYHFEHGNFLKLPMVRVAAEAESQVSSDSRAKDGPNSRKADADSRAATPVSAETSETSVAQDSDSAAFFGCVDLKYSEGGKVQVLEIGDGNTSGFTGAGAFVPNSFKALGYKRTPFSPVLDAIIEIKALTHDAFVDAGFSELRPATGVFQRIYQPGLADRVLRAVGGGPCVLKLCDRARGCGVVAVMPADMDATLRALLEPAGEHNPAVQLRVEQAPSASSKAASIAEWVAVAQRASSLHGFEEQVAHWQADECPCFLAEALCQSRVVEDSRGNRYDGTLRVGFALEEDLTVRLCGSYWKLPDGSVDDAAADLNRRVVSHTHGGTGTAACEADVETAVWAVLQKALPAVLSINTPRYSVPGILERYSEDPLLQVMALARAAAGLAAAKPDVAARTLMLADEALPNYAMGELEQLANMARSYVLRTRGTLLARRQKAKIDWAAAQPMYQTSLTIMPQNAAAAYLQGMVSFTRGNYTAAARLFASSLALDCDFASAYSQLATCCLLLGDPAACVTVSEAMISRHWRVAAGHHHLAVALYAQEAADCGRDLERRARAMATLRLAKKLQRGKSWGKEDDEMLAALEGEEPVPRVPVRTWLFHTWRN